MGNLIKMIFLLLNIYWNKNEIANPSYFIKTLVDVDIDSIFNQIINKEKGDIKLRIFFSIIYIIFIFLRI